MGQTFHSSTIVPTCGAGRAGKAQGSKEMMEKKPPGGLPVVSVIIPMRNEEKYIGGCLESVISQDYPKELIEVMVVDGASCDGSLEIVREFMEEHSNIKLLGGPGVNCPAAMNIGIREAAGDIIAKVDAHGYVASDFLRMSVKYLSGDGEIRCVGGPITPVVDTNVAKANAIARSSVFGVGKGVYSAGEKAQFVETVQCGVYKKGVFGVVGLFDESLQFGEDEEINWRIIISGCKILLTPEVRFFYFPRNSFRKLFRQYFNYGAARVKVVQKHPHFFNVKHVIPTAFFLALFGTGTLSLFSNLFGGLFLGIVLLYVIVSLGFSAVIGAKEGWKCICLLPVSFAALHLGYGMGFCCGIMGYLAVISKAGHKEPKVKN